MLQPHEPQLYYEEIQQSVGLLYNRHVVSYGLKFIENVWMYYRLHKKYRPHGSDHFHLKRQFCI